MAVLEDPNPGEVIVNLANLCDISSLCLPSPISGEIENVVIKNHSCISKSIVEPVGRWFESYQTRRHSRHTNSCHSVESSDEEDEDSSTLEEETEEEVFYLRNLDPKDWKSQDHYAVFGLKHKRHEATEAELKKAYRRKVLRHHPDKRRGAGEIVRDLDRDYFSCITKGYEVLGNPIKRRAYDSVDPEFNDDIPPNNTNSKDNFFKVYAPVFERNARWSTKKPVPKLGDENSTVEDVDRFYQFWYDFDSWREFSYLDEEEKEKGENREERKWIEKQNKAARQKLKKEETSRMRQLIDNAYACDPRIAKFKEEEKQKKLAQKQARIEAAKAKSIEEEKKRQEVLEAERKVKEREEMEAKALRDKEKKEKEALKKQLKKERKMFQQICENNKYFTTEEDLKITRLQEVDLLCKLLSLERLQALNKDLQSGNAGNRETSFMAEVKAVNLQLQKENEELTASLTRSSTAQSEQNSQKNWNHEDVQLLVKAVNLFPAGTTNRWEVVAAFINQHSTSGTTKLAKEALAKAKDLQKYDANLKDEVNKKAFEKLEKSQKPVPAIVKEESTPTERFESPAEQQGLNPTTWTADEQKLLEQALKTYPTNVADRWDKIAECLPGRSKKDCMKRYKDLVELVKAKKAAQAAATKAAKK